MSQYTFKHLVLLIGTNPLPNFVVAEYFLKENSELTTIWLVHSEHKPDIQQSGTKNFAEKLKLLLQQRHPERSVNFEFVALANVSRAKEIDRSLTTKCLDKLEDRSTVHLNYTGGTKVMSTHIYRTMERSPKISQRSCSYLDPKSFRIIFDDERLPDSDDLRKEIKMTFEEMISLHGYIRILSHPKETSQQFAEAVQAFANLIDSDRLTEYFDSRNGGYNRVLFHHKKRSDKLAEEKRQLKLDDLQAYAPNAAFATVLNVLPEHYRLMKDGKFTDAELRDDATCKYVVKFLDGLWLEEYVHAVLRDNFLREQFSLEKNWEIKKIEWEGDSRFELDVIIIKGYQLIGISCTTSRSRSLCKNKGFEIIQRVRQIGGDEAKAVLVTRLPESEKQGREIIYPREMIEKELRLDTGSGENIIVLGEQDLKSQSLLQKIQDFINE